IFTRACRHGTACTREHKKPIQSQTLLLTNFYHNPKHKTIVLKGQVIEKAPTFTDEEEQKHFDEVFEEVYIELEDEYGQIEEMNICQNLGRHLYGNVYVKFRRYKSADKALLALNNRWFDGRPINAELSPVFDFYVACCPQYEKGWTCDRGDFCNFMHLKPISKEAKKRLSALLIQRELERNPKRRHKSNKSRRKYSSKSSSDSYTSNTGSRGSSRSHKSSHRTSSGTLKSSRSSTSSGSHKSSYGSKRRTRSPSRRSTPTYGNDDKRREERSGKNPEVRSSLEKYIIDDFIGEALSNETSKDGFKNYPSTLNQNLANRACNEKKNLPLIDQYFTFDSAEESS
ncbi:splicing factor U2AF 35 kDa subunit-like protein, partial [Gordionus sp. m RMFG-2023]|uniref:splicing factor U2AF 35 kDa subunit-like protein n=1 Tax=Gordionus sp. m RMFG-2023 TaxID=3053472 RepID=UPI0031FE0C65